MYIYYRGVPACGKDPDFFVRYADSYSWGFISNLVFSILYYFLLYLLVRLGKNRTKMGLVRIRISICIACLQCDGGSYQMSLKIA